MARIKVLCYPMLFLALALLLWPALAGRAAPAATSPAPLAPANRDFRISFMGPDGDTLFYALDPAVAYNPTDDEYLVVWAADDLSGTLGNDEFEIYGQRIDGANGHLVHARFRISDMGADGDPDFDAYDPAVAYNSTDNEYLVVWQGDDGADDELEIYGQRLAANGSEIGTNDFRLSTMGPPANPMADAYNPAAAYNSTDNQYLVVWHGDDLMDNIVEIYGQRLAADGTEIGTDDFAISDMGTAPMDTSFRGQDAAVAYNSTDNEYLVVWEGDDDTAPLVDNELEIFGQRLAADGSEIGTNDFRLSDMGPDGDPLYAADNPAVAYNSTANGYLVVWSGDDDTAPLVDNELEVFGQCLAADGSEVGTNDFRLSSMGPDGDPHYKSYGAETRYVAPLDQYLVVWRGDDDRDFGYGPLVNDEFEIFGQWLDGTTGTEIGLDDFRLSDAGPDGDPAFDADRPAVDIRATGGSFLVVWQGDDDLGTLVEGEVEVLGRRYSSTGVDLAMAKSVTPHDAGPGQPVTYTLSIFNAGPGLAGGVVLTDIVPLALTDVHVSSSGVAITDTHASPPYVWVVQDLLPGQLGTITITGLLSPCLPAGHFTNTATITTSSPGDYPDNNSAAAAVTITNVPPVAADDTYTIDEDTVLIASVLANDSDANCDVLEIGGVGLPSSGTAVISGTTQVVYTPGPGFYGTAAFTYTASDGAISDTAVVKVTVKEVRPRVTVDPLSFLVTLNPDQQTARTLTIGNLGNGALHWELAENTARDWLGEEPLSGTVAPTTSVAVAVTFDATGLAEGTYATTLEIASDDPDDPLLPVSVTLVVTETCIPVYNAGFDFSPPDPQVGQDITFVGYADGTGPLTFTWSFGDGGLGSESTVIHHYSAAADYQVTLTATNVCGVNTFTDIAVHTITVLPAPEYRVYLPIIFRNSAR